MVVDVVVVLVLDVLEVEVDEADVELDVLDVVLELLDTLIKEPAPLNFVLSMPIFAYEMGVVHPGTVQYPSHTYAVSGWPTNTLVVGMSPAGVPVKSTVIVWPGVSGPIGSMFAVGDDVKFSGRPPAPMPSDVDATKTQSP